MTLKRARFASMSLICAAAIACCASDAHAQDDPSMFALSGFGTFAATHSSLSAADFASNQFQASGAGASRNVDFEDDSKLGLQLQAHLTKKISALVQVVAREDYASRFRPTLVWANINYAFTPDFNVRVGRVEMPNFLAADYSEVGYALPWVRVPRALYNLEPVTSSDGIDASYRMHFGSVTDTIRVIAGTTTFHTPGPFRARGTGVLGLFDTIERGPLTWRVAYMHAHLQLPFGPLSSTTVYMTGVSLDMSQWFVQAEIARQTATGLSPGYIGGYATAGVRIARVTPYVTYAQAHSLDHTTAVPNMNFGERDLSAGVRWDFAKNFDLKVQYDHVSAPANSTGWFTNFGPGFHLGPSANVVTAAVDFVF